jgi:rod shape-determining protein MreD
VPFLVLVAVIQSTIMPLFSIGGTKPDLMLLVVISWSLLRGASEGLVWGFLGGLFLDVLSGSPFGGSAIALMAVSLLSGLGEMNIFKEHFLLPMALAPVGTVIYYGVILIVLELTGQSLSLASGFLRVVLPAAVVNLLAMPFVFICMRWLHHRTARRQIDW